MFREDIRNTNPMFKVGDTVKFDRTFIRNRGYDEEVYIPTYTVKDIYKNSSSPMARWFVRLEEDNGGGKLGHLWQERFMLATPRIQLPEELFEL